MKRHSFSGLKSIIDEVAYLEKPVILDLGAMMPSIFPFFSWRKCKIYSECLSDRFKSNPDITASEIDNVIEGQLINYGSNSQFDVILSWDLLNYLSLASIEKLINRLNPHCKPNTLFHMIKYTGSRIPLIPCEFKVTDERHFFTFGQTFIDRKIGIHSTYQLLKNMSQFLIKNELKKNAMQGHFVEHMLWFSPDASVHKQFTASDNNERPVVKQSLVTPGVPHTSPGIKVLCRHLKTLKNPNVLDLGPKIGQNVNLFSGFCKRVYVEDLFSSLTNWKKTQGDLASQSFSQSALNFDAPTRFDAIILWDLINYFSNEQIELLINRLVPYCRQDTRIFVMVYSLDDIPEKPQRFYLQSDEKISIMPVSNAPRKQKHRTMAQLFRHLSGFKPDGAYLLQGGMQSGISEHLLSFQGVAANGG